MGAYPLGCEEVDFEVAVLACVICVLSAVSFKTGVTPLKAQTPVSFSKDILADTGAKVFKLSRPVDAEFQA